MAKTRIVQATGTAVAPMGTGETAVRLAEVLETAMVAATQACHDAGITEPADILLAKEAAREQALAAFEQAQEAPAPEEG